MAPANGKAPNGPKSNGDKKLPARHAKARMSGSYISAHPNETMASVSGRFLNMIPTLQNNDYVYVTDDSGILVGVLSVKDLFATPSKVKVADVMRKEVIKVKAGSHQETVAILAMKYDFDAIPVVDKEGKLLGVVPSKTILDILYEENADDFLKIAGVGKHGIPLLDVDKVGPVKSAEARVPWLIVGLFGGILASAVMDAFQNSLTEFFILASFIPLIAYLSGAVSAQTTALFLRLRASGISLSPASYLPKEAVSGALMGLALGFVLFLYIAFVLGMFNVGLALWASLLIISMFASLIGFAIPALMEAAGKDPVIGAGPFGTIISDLTSLLVYFVISTWILATIGV